MTSKLVSSLATYYKSFLLVTMGYRILKTVDSPILLVLNRLIYRYYNRIKLLKVLPQRSDNGR